MKKTTEDRVHEVGLEIEIHKLKYQNDTQSRIIGNLREKLITETSFAFFNGFLTCAGCVIILIVWVYLTTAL